MVNELKVDLEDLQATSVSSVSKVSVADEKSLDILASMHYTYGPMLKRSMPSLSKKELYRIINLIIDIPPEESAIDKLNKEQKNVYFTLEKVLMAKYFMMYNMALEKEMTALQTKEDNGPELVKSDDQSTNQPS